MPCFALKIWRYAESPYLCNVFFIVLDLRLTKKIGCLDSSLEEQVKAITGAIESELFIGYDVEIITAE